MALISIRTFLAVVFQYLIYFVDGNADSSTDSGSDSDSDPNPDDFHASSSNSDLEHGFLNMKFFHSLKTFSEI